MRVNLVVMGDPNWQLTHDGFGIWSRTDASTAATIRSRTSSPAMPPVVARKLMASRSQQSSANATRTRSPFVAADLKAVGTPTPVMAPLVPANVAIEQQAVNLHDPVDSLVIGRF